MSLLRELILFCWIVVLILSVNVFRDRKNRNKISLFGIFCVDVSLTIYAITILYTYFYGSR